MRFLSHSHLLEIFVPTVCRREQKAIWKEKVPSAFSSILMSAGLLTRVSGSDTVKVDTEEQLSAELCNKPLYCPSATQDKNLICISACKGAAFIRANTVRKLYVGIKWCQFSVNSLLFKSLWIISASGLCFSSHPAASLQLCSCLSVSLVVSRQDLMFFLLFRRGLLVPSGFMSEHMRTIKEDDWGFIAVPVGTCEDPICHYFFNHSHSV